MCDDDIPALLNALRNRSQTVASCGGESQQPSSGVGKRNSLNLRPTQINPDSHSRLHAVRLVSAA